jgi:hypothetical protein
VEDPKAKALKAAEDENKASLMKGVDQLVSVLEYYYWESPKPRCWLPV